VLATAASITLLLIAFSQPPSCPDVPSCRQAALDAASRGDFETFHDLAWRAAQRGRPNDPELLYLLARAQSLSGRPGDALVMLRRLAQLGIPTDARENEDFARVRRLPGWQELEALLASVPAPGASPKAESAAPPSAAPAPAPSPAAPARRSRAKATAPAAPADAANAAATTAPAPTGGGETALSLNTSPINPVGLAYDSASRRFVLGDGDDNKLIVADEVFNHVNDLIRAAAAGFARLSAVEIDTRRGDLWATSSSGDGGASIHKLQLVSGRVLAQIDVPADLQPVALADFTIADDGTLVLVDSRGARLLRVRPAAGRFDRPVPLQSDAPTSLATGNGVTYVAHAGGISILQNGTSRITSLGAANGLSLAGLRRIRWSRGALFAIQGEGTTRLVKIRLSRDGRKATAVEPHDGDVESAGTALTISRDAAYYVAKTPDGPAIRRVGIH
jgi:hypothetical protein